MRQVVASYTGEQVFTLCMQLEAVLWWQNHFGITLSQLLEHRYHVMHIRLSDKQCYQPILSTSFSLRTKFFKFVYVLLFFFYCYFVVFQGQLVANSNFILAADMVQSQVSSGFFLLVGLVHDTEYFHLQGLNCCIIAVNFLIVLPFYLICQ